MQHKFPIFSHDVNEQSIHACGRSAIIILYSFYSVRYVDVVSVQFFLSQFLLCVCLCVLVFSFTFHCFQLLFIMGLAA